MDKELQDINPNQTKDGVACTTDRLQFVGHANLYTRTAGNVTSIQKNTDATGIDFASFVVASINKIPRTGKGLDGKDYEGADYTLENHPNGKYYFFQETVESDNKTDETDADDNLNTTDLKHQASSYTFKFQYRRPSDLSYSIWNSYILGLVNRSLTYWDKFSSSDGKEIDYTATSWADSWDVRGVEIPKRTFWTTTSHNPVLPNETTGMWTASTGYFTNGTLDSVEVEENGSGAGVVTLKLTSEYNRFDSFETFIGGKVSGATSIENYEPLQPEDKNLYVYYGLAMDNKADFSGYSETPAWNLHIKQTPSSRGDGVVLSSGGVVYAGSNSEQVFYDNDGGVIPATESDGSIKTIGAFSEQVKSYNNFGGINFENIKNTIIEGSKREYNTYGNDNTIELMSPNKFRSVGSDKAFISAWSWDNNDTLKVDFLVPGEMEFSPKLDIYYYSRHGSLVGIRENVLEGAVNGKRVFTQTFAKQTLVMLFVQGNRTIAGYVNIAGNTQHNYSANILGNQEMSGLVKSITYIDDSNADVTLVGNGTTNYTLENVKDTVLHISGYNAGDMRLKPGTKFKYSPFGIGSKDESATEHTEILHIRDTHETVSEPIVNDTKTVEDKNVGAELQTYSRDYVLGALTIKQENSANILATVPFLKDVQLPNFGGSNTDDGGYGNWNYASVRYPWVDGAPFDNAVAMFRKVEEATR